MVDQRGSGQYDQVSGNGSDRERKIAVGALWPQYCLLSVVQAILKKPLVGLQSGTQRDGIIPSSALIEVYDGTYSVRRVDVKWNGQCFSVFREDLLDACTVDDAVRVSFL